MAEEYNSPFNDSALNHFETTAHAALSHFDGSFIKDGWVYAVDHGTLIKFWVDAYKSKTDPKFYWYNFKGKKYTSKYEGYHEDDDGKVYTITHRESIKASVNGTALKSMYVEMRARTGTKIYANPGNAITVNLDDVKVTYTTYFLFNKNAIAGKDDETVTSISTSIYGETIETSYVVAAKLDTRNWYAFEVLHEAFGIDIRNKISYKFTRVYNDISSSDWEKKRAFYRLAPRWYLAELSKERLWKDFKGLVKYDVDSWFDDASNALVKCLGAVAKKEGGMAYIYKKLNDSPSYIKTIYNILQQQSKSEEQNGYIPNKTVFASLLLAICSFQNQGMTQERDRTSISYKIRPGKFRVGTGKMRPDKQGLNTLVQEEYRMGTQYQDTYMGGGSYVEIKDWYENKSTLHDLHPLDMVTCKFPDPANKSQYLEVPVPAIFLYDRGYQREMAILMKEIRIGVDLLIIAISAGTLVSGPGALWTLISLTELGIAATDITVQTFEDEIRAMKGGPEFLDKWEKFYHAGMFITGLASLPSFLLGGAKLLFGLSTLAGRQLLSMLKYSVKYAKHFPKFVDNNFVIHGKEAIKKYFPRNYNKIKDLYNEGCMLIQGRRVGESESSLFLNYKGVMLAEAKASNPSTLMKLVKDLTRGSKTQIRKALSRLLSMKSGTGGGFKYIDEATSSKMVCQEQPNSCAAACIRQVAKDKGIDVSEEFVRDIALTTERGTSIDNIRPTLQEILTENTVYGGMLDISDMSSSKILNIVHTNYQKPFIVTVRPSQNGMIHSLLVDDIIDDIVYIRDPWGINIGYGAKNGTEATMSLKDFIDCWELGSNGLIYFK